MWEWAGKVKKMPQKHRILSGYTKRWSYGEQRFQWEISHRIQFLMLYFARERDVIRSEMQPTSLFMLSSFLFEIQFVLHSRSTVVFPFIKIFFLRLQYRNHQLSENILSFFIPIQFQVCKWIRFFVEMLTKTGANLQMKHFRKYFRPQSLFSPNRTNKFAYIWRINENMLHIELIFVCSRFALPFVSAILLPLSKQQIRFYSLVDWLADSSYWFINLKNYSIYRCLFWLYINCSIEVYLLPPSVYATHTNTHRQIDRVRDQSYPTRMV